MTEHKDDLYARITAPLLAWYDGNARVLPWRENPEPYRVWVSEIMLQQTRVEAVKPYFERFLARFPDVESLADAPEEELLKLWEGLGYYNRVRNLQKGALAVQERFGGIFPRTYDEILTLPGIGEYTAGAIASIAFGLPCPAVDGNVLRVIARVTGERSDVTKPQVRREIASRLASVYPKGRCGDFTQSLMELGATVCLPNGAPKCQACPLGSFCTAHREGCERELPVRPEKKARRIERRTVFLLFCGDCVAVRKRPDRGVLARLWEFPNVEGELDGKALLEQAGQWNLRVRSVERSVCARHIFTHLEWKMSGWKIVCEEPVPLFRWVTERELREELSLPSAWKAFAFAAFPEENS